MGTANAILDAEWWWIASRITMMLDEDLERRRRDNLPAIRWQITPRKSGIIGEGYLGTRAEPVLVISIEGDTRTTIVNTNEAQVVRGFWRPIYKDVRGLAKKARSIRRESVGPTVDAIIEEYNLAKATGKKLTLRQLADQTGISYGYLRRRKSEIENDLREGNNDQVTL